MKVPKGGSGEMADINFALRRLASRADVPTTRVSLRLIGNGSFVIQVGKQEMHLGRDRDVLDYVERLMPAIDLPAPEDTEALDPGGPQEILARLIDAYDAGDSERFQAEYQRARQLLGD